MTALLQELFNEIRKDEKLLDPGMSSYLELTGALHSGRLEIRDYADLVFLLEACWLKSPEQRPRFRELLNARKELAAALFADLYGDLDAARAVVQEAQNLPAVPAVSQPVSLVDSRPPEDLKTDKGSDLSEQETVAEALGGTFHFALPVPQSKNADVRSTVPVGRGKGSAPNKRFLFTNDYLPVANRQLRQAWRALQLGSPGGDTAHIDFIRTINWTARQGFFSDLFFHKEKVNQLKLFVFIDSGSDMLAEERMGEELLQTAAASLTGDGVIPLYFRDTPEYFPEKDDWCFYDKNFLECFFLKKYCFNAPKKHTAALIFSEAGAFRNNESDTKRRDTRHFVRSLHEHMQSVVWINPAPKSRWTNPICRDLAELVSLFDSSRSDVEKAIASLKGKQVLTTTIPHAAR